MPGMNGQRHIPSRKLCASTLLLLPRMFDFVPAGRQAVNAHGLQQFRARGGQRIGRRGHKGRFQRFDRRQGHAVLAMNWPTLRPNPAAVQRPGQKSQMNVAARFLPGPKGARRRHCP